MIWEEESDQEQSYFSGARVHGTAVLTTYQVVFATSFYRRKRGGGAIAIVAEKAKDLGATSILLTN